MADANDYYDYPKGRLAQGAGDLQDVYDINVAYEDGEKSVATLRRNPSGSTHGSRSVTITFKMKIAHLGYERNWKEAYRLRKVQEYRLKVPGAEHVCVGRLTKPQITSNIDSEIEFQVSVIGRDPELHG